MEGYLKDLRDKVGPMPIILNFAVACVVNESGQILLQQRDNEGKKWGFPGGALEYGESYSEAAVCECKEETGYDVTCEALLGVYDKYFAEYPNGSAQTVVIAYTATLTGGEVTIDNKETFAVEWFSIENAPILFNEQHQNIFADFHDFLRA